MDVFFCGPEPNVQLLSTNGVAPVNIATVELNKVSWVLCYNSMLRTGLCLQCAFSTVLNLSLPEGYLLV